MPTAEEMPTQRLTNADADEEGDDAMQTPCSRGRQGRG